MKVLFLLIITLVNVINVRSVSKFYLIDNLKHKKTIDLKFWINIGCTVPNHDVFKNLKVVVSIYKSDNHKEVANFITNYPNLTKEGIFITIDIISYDNLMNLIKNSEKDHYIQVSSFTYQDFHDQKTNLNSQFEYGPVIKISGHSIDDESFFVRKTTFVKDYTQDYQKFINLNIDQKLEELNSLSNLLNLSETNSDDSKDDYIKQTAQNLIKINDFLSSTDCKSNKVLNSEDDVCLDKLKKFKNISLEKFESIIDSDVTKFLINVENKKELGVLLSTTINYISTSQSLFTSIEQYEKINKYFDNLVKNSDLIMKIFADDKTQESTSNVKLDFMNNLIFSYQNQLRILKNNLYGKVENLNEENEKFLIKYNLLINKNTLNLKQSLLHISESIMNGEKLDGFFKETSTLSYKNFTSVKKVEYIDQIDRNIVFNDNKSEKLNYNCTISFEDNKDLLITLFKSYPSIENSNLPVFLPTVISIKEKNNKRRLYNLDKNIVLTMNRIDPSYTTCIYFDDEKNIWSTKGVTTKIIDDFNIECTSNHLTEFSLAKFDPTSIFEDMFNILKDIRIIYSFKQFSLLNASNAFVIYFTTGILVIFCFLYLIDIKINNKNKNNLLDVTNFVTTNYEDDSGIVIIPKKFSIFYYCTWAFLVSKLKFLRIQAESKNYEDENAELQTSNEIFDEFNNDKAKTFISKASNQINNKKVLIYFNNIKKEFQLKDIDIQAISDCNNNNNNISHEQNNISKVNSEDNCESQQEQIEILDQGKFEVTDESENKNISTNIGLNETYDKTDVDERYSIANDYAQFKLNNFLKLYLIVRNNSISIFSLFSTYNYRMRKIDIYIYYSFKILYLFFLSSLLSPNTSKSGNKEFTLSGYTFSSRSLAVTCLTFIIGFIPLFLIRYLLYRRKIDENFSEEMIEKEKKKYKIFHALTYLLMFVLTVLGFINTLWLSMKNIEGGRYNTFYLDYLYILVIELTIKQSLYLFLKMLILLQLFKTSTFNFCLKTFLAMVIFI